MFQRTLIVAALIIMSFSSGPALQSHAATGSDLQWRGSGGWGAGLPYGRHFDPALIKDVAGEIVAVERFTPLPGMAEGVLMQLRTPEEIIGVHLAPLWFLERQDVAMTVGSRVTVHGSRTRIDGKAVMLAIRVTGSGRVLTLREESGLPLWSAWRQETAH